MSRKLITLLSLSALCILVLAAWRPAEAPESIFDAEPLLPMSFAHIDHAEQNCLGCHHNFQDDVGPGGLCIGCHQTSEEVFHLIEPQFHGLCMDCHMTSHLEGKATGPLRSCIACHQEDFLP